jgi:hypothetical protein
MKKQNQGDKQKVSMKNHVFGFDSFLFVVGGVLKII